MNTTGKKRPCARRAWLLVPVALAGLALLPSWRRALPATVRHREDARLPPVRENIGPLANPENAAVPEEEPGPSYQDFLDALTREFPFGRERQSVLAEMLEDAPAEAVEALLRLSFGDENLNDISHVLLERLAGLAPEAVLAFARENAFGVEPPWWHSVIGGLADPRAALPDIFALPESGIRTDYFGHIALRVGLDDPGEAVRFARSAPPEARTTALLNAVFAAARRDHAQGFDLALIHGPEAGEPALVKSIAVDWAMDDYPAASARILAMPDGEARRTALAGLASVAIERDWENAWPLIEQVNEPDTRRALHRQAAKRFFLLDAAKAEDWLTRTTELSSGEKAEVREFYRQAIHTNRAKDSDF